MNILKKILVLTLFLSLSTNSHALLMCIMDGTGSWACGDSDLGAGSYSTPSGATFSCYEVSTCAVMQSNNDDLFTQDGSEINEVIELLESDSQHEFSNERNREKKSQFKNDWM